MSAIVTALSSTTLTRLTLTFERLPRNSRRALDKMARLLEPDHNHKEYRAKLGTSVNKPEPCIPLFGMDQAPDA